MERVKKDEKYQKHPSKVPRSTKPNLKKRNASSYVDIKSKRRKIIEQDDSSSSEEEDTEIKAVRKDSASHGKSEEEIEDFDSSEDDTNPAIADSSHSGEFLLPDSHHIEDNSDSEDNNSDNEGVSRANLSFGKDVNVFGGWSKEDILKLLSNIEKSIPQNDSFKYSSRVEKLDWGKVKLDNYSESECKEKWKFIQKKLRKYRVLKELVEDAKSWVEKPWVEFYRSVKKNKHPDMPKRPLSSYMLFYLEKKDEMVALHPGLDMTSISKLIAAKFKTLSEEEKSRYSIKATALRRDYTIQLKQFMDDHPDEAAVIFKKKSQTAQSNATSLSSPVKPLTPFELFLEEKLKKNPSLKKSEYETELREQWKNMNEKKKSPWIQWAKEAEINYLEWLNCKAEDPNFVVPKHKPVLSKEEQKIFERMQGKPEKPPNSAYSLFSRLLLRDPELRECFSTPNERMKEIANLWQLVSPKEKEAYAQKAKLLMENYKLEYASYLETLSEDKREEELGKNKPKKRVQRVRNKVLKERSEEKETTSEARINFLANEPKPPPTTPFLLFKKNYLLNPSHKDVSAKAAWNKLSERESERYKTKHEELKQKYLIEYREFLMKMKPDELKQFTALRCNSAQPNNDDGKNDESSDESDIYDSLLDSEDDKSTKELLEMSSSELSD